MKRGIALSGRVLVAVLAVWATLSADLGAYQAFQSGVVLLDRSAHRPNWQEQVTIDTLRRELISQVPEGSRIIFLGGGNGDADWSVQRIAELASLRGIMLVPGWEQADYTVKIVPAPWEQSPGGLHIVAERIR